MQTKCRVSIAPRVHQLLAPSLRAPPQAARSETRGYRLNNKLKAPCTLFLRPLRQRLLASSIRSGHPPSCKQLDNPLAKQWTLPICGDNIQLTVDLCESKMQKCNSPHDTGRGSLIASTWLPTLALVGSHSIENTRVSHYQEYPTELSNYAASIERSCRAGQYWIFRAGATCPWS